MPALEAPADLGLVGRAGDSGSESLQPEVPPAEGPVVVRIVSPWLVTVGRVRIGRLGEEADPPAEIEGVGDRVGAAWGPERVDLLGSPGAAEEETHDLRVGVEPMEQRQMLHRHGPQLDSGGTQEGPGHAAHYAPAKACASERSEGWRVVVVVPGTGRWASGGECGVEVDPDGEDGGVVVEQAGVVLAGP